MVATVVGVLVFVVFIIGQALAAAVNATNPAAARARVNILRISLPFDVEHIPERATNIVPNPAYRKVNTLDGNIPAVDDHDAVFVEGGMGGVEGAVKIDGAAGIVDQHGVETFLAGIQS